MEFNPLSTQNWNRMFNVWIEDIQVQFQPVVRITLNGGGVLRRVRSVTRVSAALLTLFFSLHCTKPPVQIAHPGGEEKGLAGEAGSAFTETGDASWYGGHADGLAGKSTANGEVMDPAKLTCAHRTLPLDSYIQVENLENGRRATLRINDRGPFIRGRILDVSRQAAVDLGFLEKGLTRVRIRSVQKDGRPAPIDPGADLADPYTIQVAALSDPANIERLSRELDGAFGSVTLQDAVARDGRSVKRVRVGTYTRLEDAEKAADQIAKRFGDRGVEPFITRRR